jgi:hypothetical protein
MLRDRISIEDYQGDSAYGAVFAAARVVKAKVEGRLELVVDRQGNTVRAEAHAIVRPEAGPVPLESRVTWAGKTYRVLHDAALPGETRPSHRELVLG